MTNRILWNHRPGPDGRDGGSIDEVFFTNPTAVHIEQMDDRAWTIIVELPDDREWIGNIYCDSRGRMNFTEQEHIEFTIDETHQDPAPIPPAKRALTIAELRNRLRSQTRTCAQLTEVIEEQGRTITRLMKEKAETPRSFRRTPDHQFVIDETFLWRDGPRLFTCTYYGETYIANCIGPDDDAFLVAHITDDQREALRTGAPLRDAYTNSAVAMYGTAVWAGMTMTLTDPSNINPTAIPDEWLPTPDATLPGTEPK